MDPRLALPKFSANFNLKVGNETHSFTFDGEPPEELMDAFQSLVNPADPLPGAAKVSASASLDVKDFGTGCGGSVSITLSCDQNQQKIHEAITLASQTALHYAKYNRSEVEKELREILTHRQPYGK